MGFFRGFGVSGLGFWGLRAYAYPKPETESPNTKPLKSTQIFVSLVWELGVCGRRGPGGGGGGVVANLGRPESAL